MCATSSGSEIYRTSKYTFERKREWVVFREEIKSLREAGDKEGFPEIRKIMFKVRIMIQERPLVLEQ